MDYQELLKGFAEKIETDELVPDDSGVVALEVDGMELSIMGIEELEQVVITGVIGEPPPQDALERLYRALLEANHNFTGTFGATVSVNPESGEVSLCKSLPLPLMDAEKLFSEVEHFVNTLETWRKIVSDFRGAIDGQEESAAGAREPDAAVGGLPGLGGDFMQV